jgi:5-methylcytosine-specific restriction endonuclease McrA
MENLVTACQPCNLIKGKRHFASRDEAKKYVLAKREEWREHFQATVKAAGAAGASH